MDFRGYYGGGWQGNGLKSGGWGGSGFGAPGPGGMPMNRLPGTNQPAPWNPFPVNDGGQQGGGGQNAPAPGPYQPMPMPTLPMKPPREQMPSPIQNDPSNPYKHDWDWYRNTDPLQFTPQGRQPYDPNYIPGPGQTPPGLINAMMGGGFGGGQQVDVFRTDRIGGPNLNNLFSGNGVDRNVMPTLQQGGGFGGGQQGPIGMMSNRLRGGPDNPVPGWGGDQQGPLGLLQALLGGFGGGLGMYPGSRVGYGMGDRGFGGGMGSEVNAQQGYLGLLQQLLGGGGSGGGFGGRQYFPGIGRAPWPGAMPTDTRNVGGGIGWGGGYPSDAFYSGGITTNAIS